MLPQPDPHVLDSNPLFAALYKDLETTKLEANGRGRVGLGVGDKVGLKERGEVEEVSFAFWFRLMFALS